MEVCHLANAYMPVLCMNCLPNAHHNGRHATIALDYAGMVSPCYRYIPQICRTCAYSASRVEEVSTLNQSAVGKPFANQRVSKLMKKVELGQDYQGNPSKRLEKLNYCVSQQNLSVNRLFIWALKDNVSQLPVG